MSAYARQGSGTVARAVLLVGVVHLQVEVAAVESQSETILVRLVQYAVSKIITG